MKSDQLDFKEILRVALRYWYIFAVGFPLIFSASIFYLVSTPSIYEANALLLIKEQKESGQISEEFILDELAVRGRFRNLENEILVLTSLGLLETVVQNLELHHEYFLPQQFVSEDLYNISPIRILNWEENPEYCINSDNHGCGLQGKVVFNNEDGFLFYTSDSSYQGSWSTELILPQGILTLAKTDLDHDKKEIEISISSISQKAQQIKEALVVEVIGENSSALRLTIWDNSRARAQDILSELLSVYNEVSIEERSRIYRNTIDLINDRISLVTNELDAAESGVENYKKKFSMVEVGSAATILMNDLTLYNKEISDRKVQIEILESIENFLVQQQDSFTFVPTNMSLNNLTLSRLLESFNSLLSQRDKSRIDLGPSHPDLKLIEKQIQNLRQTIIFNIQSIKADLTVGQQADLALKESLENRLQSLPTRERQLIAMERQKAVKENLYLYLLQKREEAAVSLVATNAPGKILQVPVAKGPVRPVKAQVLLIGLFFGLALPAGFVALLENFNDRIRSEDEIRELTSATLVGSIGQRKAMGYLAVQENRVSYMDEMFRLLRTNLAYILPGKDLRVFLVTSSMPGEGKTFIAENLGMTQALANKKVIVLNLDFRIGTDLFKNEGMRKNLGIVNYLVDDSLSFEEIIEPSGFHHNLDVINAGPTPPNPGEMILSPRLHELIKDLKSNYDFILLDAPPIGPVADAFEINKLADATLFVVRVGTTRRHQLHYLNDLIKDQKLTNLCIVLNGVGVGGLLSYGTRFEYMKYHEAH